MENQFITEIVRGDKTEVIQSSKRLLMHLEQAVRSNIVPLLIGPTGTGKSMAIKWLAANNGFPHLTVGLKPSMGREEMIGSVRPTPQGLAWQWGFLIRAMVKGDWVTLEEVNLAPSEVIEFLNEFLNSGFVRLNQFLDPETLQITLPEDVYKSLEAKGFILQAHPGFRLFMTMNPDFYMGRKKLSKTLMNRTAALWVPDYTLHEIELILQNRYGITPERSLQIVENIYKGVKAAIAAGHLGHGQKDKYEFNLRTLLKALDLYKGNLSLYSQIHGGKAADKKTDMQLLGRAIWEVMGSMLRSETDRQQVWHIMDKGLGFNNHGIELKHLQPDVQSIRFDEATREVVFEDEILPLRLPLRKGKNFIPPEEFDLAPTPQTLNHLYWMARRLQRNEHMLLVGETAVGKTFQVQFLHRLLNAAVYYTNMSSDSSIEELEGGYQPLPGQPGKFEFRSGLLEKAGTDNDGQGSTLFIDEFNLSGIVEWLNTAQDDKILVTPKGVVHLGPQTVIVGAMNPPSYQSRNLLSPASRGRYWERWVEEPDPKEMAVRVGWWLKKNVEDK